MTKEINKLSDLISRKRALLPEGISVIEPNFDVPATTQADWLISLLHQMYITHGITSRRDNLMSDIQSGNCRCWFALENGLPIASVAQVEQSDGSVELGRAVSFRQSVGSLLMLLAAQHHLESKKTPLVAEIRVADEFQGIRSGEATQTICLKHLALTPHALVPAFNHGSPVRNEFFLFATSNRIQISGPAVLPAYPRASDFLRSTALKVSSEMFQGRISVIENGKTESTRWGISTSAPFSILFPESKGIDFDSAISSAEAHAPFTLVPITASPSNSGAMIECLNAGFIPCGIDRKLDSSGHPIILFGKLRNGTVLAPIKIVPGNLTNDQASAISRINSGFRNK